MLHVINYYYNKKKRGEMGELSLIKKKMTTLLLVSKIKELTILPLPAISYFMGLCGTRS